MRKIMDGLAQANNQIKGGPGGQRVYRVGNDHPSHEPLERRIVELADGRSLAEIIQILYAEEVRAGAWIVDIALWKEVFDGSVMVAVRRLAERGCLYLEP